MTDVIIAVISQAAITVGAVMVFCIRVEHRLTVIETELGVLKNQINRNSQILEKIERKE
jgi:thiamine phosphate synthase YjbQ (UPF0047 family)